MKKILTALISTAMVSLATATEVQQPSVNFNQGDEWIYRQQVLVPDQPSSDAYMRFKIGYKNIQNQWQLGYAVGKDKPNTVWSRLMTLTTDECLVDLLGKMALGLKNSCAIRLTPGMAWQVDNENELTITRRQLKITGQEQVKTVLGNYIALRIEAHEEVSEMASTSVIKRIHAVYWYAPELRGMIKIERENTNAEGKRTMFMSEELEMFKPGIAQAK